MITLIVNGVARSVDVESDTPLLYVLRDNLGVTGPKYGCGVAQCGSCTVLVDGEAKRSCIVPVGTVAGAAVTTVEGLGTPQQLHPIQAAFVEEQAAQCGYCTAGMVMTAKALLDKKPKPSEAEIREALASNLCRCGSHVRVVRAVQRAAGTRSS
jgi:nicotinate dehydrogenase subunit A